MFTWPLPDATEAPADAALQATAVPSTASLQATATPASNALESRDADDADDLPPLAKDHDFKAGRAPLPAPELPAGAPEALVWIEGAGHPARPLPVNATRCIAPNGERSHTGPQRLDWNRGALAALADASGLLPPAPTGRKTIAQGKPRVREGRRPGSATPRESGAL